MPNAFDRCKLQKELIRSQIWLSPVPSRLFEKLGNETGVVTLKGQMVEEFSKHRARRQYLAL